MPYGTNGNSDPGWNVADQRLFTPVIDVAAPSATTYSATRIRASRGQPLGIFHWLVWAVVPGDADSVLESADIQKWQVISSPRLASERCSEVPKTVAIRYI